MTDEQKPPPKRRGRKPGTGLGVKTGPRVGSRPWQLSRMSVGDVLFFEAPLGQTGKHMQQIQTDIGRLAMVGSFEQTHFIAVQPTTKHVIDIVRVERIERN